MPCVGVRRLYAEYLCLAWSCLDLVNTATTATSEVQSPLYRALEPPPLSFCHHMVTGNG